MADRWMYDKDGKPRFYQNGKYFYSAETHECEYYEQEGYIYSFKGTGAVFFVREKWWHAIENGTASYFSND
jgi:hypothetical protein